MICQCASLLHVWENEIDDAIKKIKTSLSDNGILYASFKYGDGTTEKHDRSFLNYTEETIQEMMERAGFEILECESTTDVRPGREEERWISIIGMVGLYKYRDGEPLEICVYVSGAEYSLYSGAQYKSKYRTK